MEEIFAKGKIFELVHETQTDGRIFEVARRAPGVRVIVYDEAEQKILLTKEFRKELQAWDYRLPGGKVFDSLEEYEAFRMSGKDIITAASEKVAQEIREEAGLQVMDSHLFKKSILGATVEWDLYIFETNNWSVHEGGRHLEAGEQVEADNWFGFDEVTRMIMRGKMQEERIALVLLQWIEVQKEKENEV